MNAQSTPRTRADVNRANAAHACGPKTAEGKARSAQNSFKHGLYSKDLITPGENPAEFDELRATLREEHQPVNTTEEILVDELAQSFWRMRRFRHLEAGAWDPAAVNKWVDTGLMTLVQRAANSAERSFHKTLATLAKLQKERGFVPQKTTQEQAAVVEHQSAVEEPGFVPEKTAADHGFVPEKTNSGLEFFEYLPEDVKKHVDSLLDKAGYPPLNVQTAA